MWELRDLDTGEVVIKEDYEPDWRPSFVGTNLRGLQIWRKDGKLHRLDGPAITHANGEKRWYKEDKFHRIAGPAVILANGEEQWWIGKELYYARETTVYE